MPIPRIEVQADTLVQGEHFADRGERAWAFRRDNNLWVADKAFAVWERLPLRNGAVRPLIFDARGERLYAVDDSGAAVLAMDAPRWGLQEVVRFDESSPIPTRAPHGWLALVAYDQRRGHLVATYNEEHGDHATTRLVRLIVGEAPSLAPVSPHQYLHVLDYSNEQEMVCGVGKGGHLLVLSMDGTNVAQCPSQRLTRDASTMGSTARFSPNGDRILVSSNDGIRCWLWKSNEVWDVDVGAPCRASWFEDEAIVYVRNACELGTTDERGENKTILLCVQSALDGMRTERRQSHWPPRMSLAKTLIACDMTAWQMDPDATEDALRVRGVSATLVVDLAHSIFNVTYERIGEPLPLR